MDAILNSHVDLQTTAIVENAPEATGSTIGKTEEKVTIRRYEPTFIELDVTSPAPGMAVLSDTYFPGWIARVDGKLAKVYLVDYALRGVPVEAGSHTVILTYEPISFRFGLMGTALGVIVFFVSWWYIKKYA